MHFRLAEQEIFADFLFQILQISLKYGISLCQYIAILPDDRAHCTIDTCIGMFCWKCDLMCLLHFCHCLINIFLFSVSDR